MAADLMDEQVGGPTSCLTSRGPLAKSSRACVGDLRAVPLSQTPFHVPMPPYRGYCSHRAVQREL